MKLKGGVQGQMAQEALLTNFQNIEKVKTQRLQTEFAYFKAWNTARKTIEQLLDQFKNGDFATKSADDTSTDPEGQIIELKKEIQHLVKELDDQQKQNGQQVNDLAQ